MTPIPPVTVRPLPERLGPTASLRGGLVEARQQVVYAVTGDLVYGTATGFERRLSALAAGTVGDVVLDLSGMDFADSSGLRALVTIRRHLEDARRRLVLRDPSPPVRRLLVLAGFDGLFEIDSATRPAPADATAQSSNVARGHGISADPVDAIDEP